MRGPEHYESPNDPKILKWVAQRIARDPKQPDIIRQAARDIAAAAQEVIDRRSSP